MKKTLQHFFQKVKGESTFLKAKSYFLPPYYRLSAIGYQLKASTISYKLKAISYLTLLLFLSTTPLFASATENKLINPIKFPNLMAFLLEIVNVTIQYGAILIVFFIVFAGFKFVTAQGNSEKISEARKMLTWIIVGAFVLLGVYVIKAAICGTIETLGVQNACELTSQ